MGTGGGWQDGLCPRAGWGRPARTSGGMTRPSDHAAPLLRSSLVILHPPPRRRPCLPGTAAQPCSEVAARDEVGKERRPCLVSGITPMGPMGRTSLRLLRTRWVCRLGAGEGPGLTEGEPGGGAVGWGRGLWAVPEATGRRPPSPHPPHLPPQPAGPAGPSQGPGKGHMSPWCWQTPPHQQVFQTYSLRSSVSIGRNATCDASTT